MAPVLLRRDAIDLSEGLDVVGYIVVAHMGGNITDLEDSFSKSSRDFSSRYSIRYFEKVLQHFALKSRQGTVIFLNFC